MESLVLRPEVPKTTVVYKTVPVTSTITTARASSADTGADFSAQDSTEAGTEQETEEQATEQREANLLTRDRGYLGTVQTSYRGLLNATSRESGVGAKTLLGE